ncbi:unnamed protein product [Phyllotreta striolata]|uniref:Uncharacterized protein n=1 Tax=Phyllotreta striolata TaxID=444603 RepID=A0A9N9TZ41_PHYSR|nr:unnamed protein product [Phyllotreta striolata]
MILLYFSYYLSYTNLFFSAKLVNDYNFQIDPCSLKYFDFNASKPEKFCRLREDLFDQRLWNYVAGYQCYCYTNPNRFNRKYAVNVLHQIDINGDKVNVPGVLLPNNITINFDYTDEASLRYIRKSFKNNIVFDNYMRCCREAENCCNNEMNNDNIDNSETYCSAIWDAWTCFPPTKVNTVARLPCSSQAYQDPDEVCTLESEKECITNSRGSAEWVQQTDYTVCAIAPVYEGRYTFHIIFLSVCIAICVPAIGVFFAFDKLRKTIRVVLHRNLLIAICVRNAFTIMSKELVLLDQLKGSTESHHRMEQNGAGCRTLAFLEASAVNSIYACMFLDAFYLHKVIVRAFAKEIRMVYVYIGLFAMTFTFSICWAISMAVKKAENCWMVDVDGLQWTLDGYRIAVLIINTFLLMDIMRVMLCKLKHGSLTKQTISAFKATIILIPLFGLHIIVTAKKIVYDDSCKAEDLYNKARYSMEAMQGIIVSIIFCYANQEVRNELKNGYRKTCIFLNQRFGWNVGNDLLYDRRRATTATFVQEANF